MPSILHATDFSRASGPAFAKALELAKRDRRPLVLVHVARDPMLPVSEIGYVPPQSYQDLRADIRKHAERRLARLAARAKAAGVRAITRVLEGAASDAIVRAAKRARADVIVMGTRGHTGLARFFLGSVAARVIAAAPCPVLTVRGR